MTTKENKSKTPAQPQFKLDMTVLLALAAGSLMSATIGCGVARIGNSGFLPSLSDQAQVVLSTMIGYAPTEDNYDIPLAQTPGTAGRFLASHFAQSQNDWTTANTFIAQILDKEPTNFDLMKRSMVLAMGDGDLPLAAQRAKELLEKEPTNSLAMLFLGVDALARHDSKAADEYIGKMAGGDVTDFVKPLLKGWAQAGLGQLMPVPRNATSIMLYHSGMMAIFLDDQKKAIEYAKKILKLKNLAEMDVERAADLLAAAGERDDALAIYESISKQGIGNERLEIKLAALKDETPEGIAKLKTVLTPLRIKTSAQGAALVMYDMGYILSFQNSDSSSKLFTSMALQLDPDLIEARLLLADTMSRNGRIDDAITQLESIPVDHPSYLEAQRHAAELYADAGRIDESLALLNKLFIERNDVDSLIRIGDIYREKENFRSALEAYNKAAKKIGGTIPEQYWYLLYGRGMAYERQGDWAHAQNDLKAALIYRPDHPYLLNYLAYGWADKGENLDESLTLIKKAASLRPADGYITDSLGWVQYMRGQYEDAIPNLEHAVELLPYDDTINDHLGDAYWQVGRKVEARFQWQRAINNSKDKDFQERVTVKMRDGLTSTTRHATGSRPTKVE